MPSDNSITPGSSVVTFDHRRAGAVIAVHEGRLLVKPRGRRPYWIADILVRDVGQDTVQLHVNQRVLRRYQEPAEPRLADEAGVRAATERSAGWFAAVASVIASTLFVGR